MSTNTTTLGRQLLQRSMVALALSALGIWGFSGLAKMPNLHAAGPVAAPPVDQQAIHQANSLSHTFRSASERVLPAVVMIQHVSAPEAVATDETGKQPALPEGIPEEFRDNPMLRRFFGDSQGHRAEAPRQASMGSGVIIDASGIILTNNHVVAGGGKVTVRLHDGREFVATDVKTDPETDIAVVRIHADGDLPVAAEGTAISWRSEIG